MVAPAVVRSESLFRPQVQNPFKFELQIPWYRKIQMAIATVTLVPIRLILMITCLLMGWVLASIILIGTTPEQLAKAPIDGWRKKMRRGAQLCCQASLVFFGIIWRKVGTQADQTEAPVLTVAPHSSFYDTVIMLLLDTIPYAVSRVENMQIPIIGKLCQLAQPVFVYREDKDSRVKTIAELKRRALSNGLWPQFLIFPEGTTTNRQALISFKAGAFIPGQPVQPVLLRYPDSWDSVTWTWEGPGAFMLLWMCLCKLWTVLEVEFLPVYTPNEQERADPYLYAENVRKVMAQALGVPETDHTFEDCRLMEFAKKANLKMGDGLVEFRKMQKKLGLTYDKVRELLDKFSVMSQLNENGGQVDIQTFSKYMGVPINNTLKELFSMYDWDGSGHIDFREYVIGMSLISEPDSAEETVALAFKLFDKENKGYVTKTEFSELLVDTLDSTIDAANSLYDKVDSLGSGKITFDDFKTYAAQMPEYASLFTTYHRIKGDDSAADLAIDPKKPSLVSKGSKISSAVTELEMDDGTPPEQSKDKQE